VRSLLARAGLAVAAFGTYAGIGALAAQQVPDTTFRPRIEKPAYLAGTGPVVQIDEAHQNFHTATGRYLPFAELLRRDGYVVRASVVRFTADALRSGSVLVVSNAKREKDPGASAPPDQSAFSDEEIATLRDWVAGGGSLLLIADHDPWASAAEALGRVFGIRFRNGMANLPKNSSGRLVFRKSDGTLMDHPITKRIDEVATFAGSSFEIDKGGEPLLVFGPKTYSYSGQSEPTPVTGHLQGAVLRFNRGRVAVFGEAAMFTAQITGEDRHPMGMNAAIAKQNPQFVLNVMHWLTKTK
jgi:hypothetical protein